MARLFCGPDKSEWISESYATPTATVKTVLEAIRRDDPDVMYRAFSESFKASNGFDNMTYKLAWEQLKETIPGLHLAGYADVPEPTLGDNGATFVLDIEGRKLRLDLVRQSFLEMHWQREVADDPDAPPGEIKRRLGSFSQAMSATYLEDAEVETSRITLRPFLVEHFNEDGIPLRNIDSVGILRRWLVAGLEFLEE